MSYPERERVAPNRVLQKETPSFAGLPVELVPFPDDRDGLNFLSPDILRYFDPRLYRQNYAILRTLAGIRALDKKSGFALRHIVYPVLDIGPEEAIRMIEGIKSAPTVEQTLGALTGRSLGYGPVETIEEIDGFYDGLLDRIRAGETLCPVSRTHMTDLLLADALVRREKIPPEKMAVVVLDEHIDIGPFSIDDPSAIYHKSEFLRGIMVLGIPVVILGLNDGRIEESVEEKIGSNDGFTVEDLVKRLSSKMKGDSDTRLACEAGISLLTARICQYYIKEGLLSVPKGLFTTNGRTSKPQMMKVVGETVDFLQSRGTEHIWVSVCSDVFDLLGERMTAVPYNPYNQIALLGMQDLKSVVEREYGFGEEEDRMSYWRREMNELVRLKKVVEAGAQKIGSGRLRDSQKVRLLRERGRFEEIAGRFDTICRVCAGVSDFLYPAAGLPEEIASAGQREICAGTPYGLSMKEARRIVTMLRDVVGQKGISFGVPLGRGILPGTISEVDGPDYEGRTAVNISRMVQTLIELAR